MKTFLTLTTLLIALTASANSTGTFKPCELGDLISLENAQTRIDSVHNFIKDELIEIPNCSISKPRFVHPAVCGVLISQVDTYVFILDRSARVTVQVDKSYIACDMNPGLSLPRVTKLKFVDLPISPEM
ncbi:MAG: hypothetical protein CME62_00230 [Halobacteriovoraceae bacterium]|nr:hypothetical protein [Halobacteriovoraceae bacterium]